MELMAGGKFFALWADNTIVLPLKIALNESGQLHIPGHMHIGIACLVGLLIIVAFSRAGKSVSKMVITYITLMATYLLYKRSHAYAE
jgi:hypothetical protein